MNFLPITLNNLFKFQAQDSDLEYLFWRFEKRIALFEKKTPLVQRETIPQKTGLKLSLLELESLRAWHYQEGTMPTCRKTHILLIFYRHVEVF